MLDHKVKALSPEEISAGLERLIFVAKLIKTDDEPPYIREGEMSFFDLVMDSYKMLEPTHDICKKYTSFTVYQTYNLVQSRFIRQQIDEASYVLTDMHTTYQSIMNGSQPALMQEKLDEFRNALDRFRRLVQSGKLEKRYGAVLPILEKEYAEIQKYTKPKDAQPTAMPAGI